MNHLAQKKMGRPLSDNPKDKIIRIRVDVSIIEKLDRCTEALETTRSDVIRKGIEKLYRTLPKKQ